MRRDLGLWLSAVLVLGGCGDDGGDETEGTESTGDGDGDGDGLISYSTDIYFGGLDRVFVYRHDYDADTCAILSIASPVDLGQFAVTTPMGWSVEGVSVLEGADCAQLSPPFAYATAGTGSVDFVSLDMNGYFPCELDIAATFELDTMPVEQLEFAIVGLAVTGASC